MFVTSVDVRLLKPQDVNDKRTHFTTYGRYRDDVLEVVNVDVDEDAMQSREDFTAVLVEILGER